MRHVEECFADFISELKTQSTKSTLREWKEAYNTGSSSSASSSSVDRSSRASFSCWMEFSGFSMYTTIPKADLEFL